MHYECSCGFTSATASSFYKHLAAAKESGLGHQLAHARFSDKVDRPHRRADDVNQTAASAGAADHAHSTDSAAPNASALTAATSWVDEYLMVDQRDAAGHPQRNPALAAAPTQLRLPVPSAAATPHPHQQPSQQQQPAVTATEPQPEPQDTPRGWSLGRQRSGGSGRPPTAGVPSGKAAAKAGGGRQAEVMEEEVQRAAIVDADEVELIERVSGSGRLGSGRTRTTTPPSAAVHPGSAAAGSPLAPTSSGGLSAQAALRLSVNAVMVGLTPWRWFGNGSSGGGSGGGGMGHEGGAPGTSYRMPYVGGAGGAGASPLVEEPSSDTEAGASPGRQQGEGAEGGRYGSAQECSIAASLDAVRAVQAVLMWHNPWRTGRIFGAGLYLAVCLRQLAKGHDLLQPSTALFAACFILLLRNLVRRGVASYRQAQQGQLRLQGGPEGQQPPPPQQLEDTELEQSKASAELQQRVEASMRRAACGVAHYGAALVVLGAGLLGGRRHTTSALVAVLLWLGMVVGELRLTSQPTFWLLCYVATFTIPAAYARCGAAMDAGVEAALRFVVRVLVSGSRLALLAAGGVAAVLIAVLPYNFVLRATLAGAASFGVLLWQSEAAVQGAAGRRMLAAAAAGQAQLKEGGAAEGGGGGCHVPVSTGAEDR